MTPILRCNIFSLSSVTVQSYMSVPRLSKKESPTFMLKVFPLSSKVMPPSGRGLAPNINASVASAGCVGKAGRTTVVEFAVMLWDISGKVVSTVGCTISGMLVSVAGGAIGSCGEDASVAFLAEQACVRNKITTSKIPTFLFIGLLLLRLDCSRDESMCRNVPSRKTGYPAIRSFDMNLGFGIKSILLFVISILFLMLLT